MRAKRLSRAICRRLVAIDLVEDFFDLDAKAGRNVLARQRVRYIGGEETNLRTAIEAAAFEL